MCTFLFFGEVLFFDVRLICEQVRDVFERIASGPLEALPCKSMIPITRKGVSVYIQTLVLNRRSHCETAVVCE